MTRYEAIISEQKYVHQKVIFTCTKQDCKLETLQINMSKFARQVQHDSLLHKTPATTILVAVAIVLTRKENFSKSYDSFKFEKEPRMQILGRT